MNKDLGLARCSFEIIRESVTNSVKHGDAQKVEITLDLRRDLELTATNDGRPISDLSGYAGRELLEQLCLSHDLQNEDNAVVMRATLALNPEFEPQSQP